MQLSFWETNLNAARGKKAFLLANSTKNKYIISIMFDKVLTFFFGSQNDRDVKALKPILAKVEAKEPV